MKLRWRWKEEKVKSKWSGEKRRRKGSKERRDEKIARKFGETQGLIILIISHYTSILLYFYTHFIISLSLRAFEL